MDETTNNVVNESGIEQFVERHEITIDAQFKQLVEEIGELAEVVNTNSDIDEVAEELGDVIFVSWTLGIMYDIDVADAVNEVTAENLGKNMEMEGDKVTKS